MRIFNSITHYAHEGDDLSTEVVPIIVVEDRGKLTEGSVLFSGNLV